MPHGPDGAPGARSLLVDGATSPWRSGAAGVAFVVTVVVCAVPLWRPVLTIGIVVTSVLLALLVAGMLRSGRIELDGRGLHLRTPARRLDLAWTRVDGFTVVRRRFRSPRIGWTSPDGGGLLPPGIGGPFEEPERWAAELEGYRRRCGQGREDGDGPGLH